MKMDQGTSQVGDGLVQSAPAYKGLSDLFEHHPALKQAFAFAFFEHRHNKDSAIKREDSNALMDQILAGASDEKLVLLGLQAPTGRFTQADLRKLSFTNARMTRADFTGADIRNTTIFASQCDGANFEGAKVNGAKCEDTDFSTANLKKVRASAVSFIRANMTSADLTEGVFGEITAQGQVVTRTHAVYGKFSGSLFREAELVKVTARKIQATHCDFTDANLSGIDAEGSDFRNAVFKGTKLTGGNFTACDLRGADLSKAIGVGSLTLENALYDEHTKFPSNISADEAGAITIDLAPFMPGWEGRLEGGL